MQNKVLFSRRKSCFVLIASILSTVVNAVVCWYTVTYGLLPPEEAQYITTETRGLLNVTSNSDSRYLGPAFGKVAFMLVATVATAIYMAATSDPVCPTGICCCFCNRCESNAATSLRPSHNPNSRNLHDRTYPSPTTSRHPSLTSHTLTSTPITHTLTHPYPSSRQSREHQAGELEQTVGDVDEDISEGPRLCQWSGFRDLLSLCVPSMFFMITGWWSFEFLVRAEWEEKGDEGRERG